MKKTRRIIGSIFIIGMLCLAGCAGLRSKEEKTGEKLHVEFSVPSGVYEEEFVLKLSLKGNGEGKKDMKIYYTLDGSNPLTSESRMLYDGGISVHSRDGEANVVSAVEPVLISGNFNNYVKKEETFHCSIQEPADEAVDKCSVVRAVAIKEGEEELSTETASATYYIGDIAEHIEGIETYLERAGAPLAVISISMNYEDLFDPENGIYVKGALFEEDLAGRLARGERGMDGETARAMNANYKQRGREWERECHIDFFEMDADGGELVLNQNCGIRIQGNYSRSDLQKGFRLYARADYGTKRFEHAIFAGLTAESGESIESYKTFVLRAGGNCAFTAKFNDTYWQEAAQEMDCGTKASRPCVVYLNGEYWGLYVLEEDYSTDYFEQHYGVDKDQVVIYKGDAETYACGYKLDEGPLPENANSTYYYKDLFDFFGTHEDLSAQEDYDEFVLLVDPDSVRDYFLAQIWINNKWDWPGKNWSMWKSAEVKEGNPYADGRWRFLFYDMEFGGVCGGSEASTNTVKEDNYKPLGLLDTNTTNPAVLCYAYLMTNEAFRKDFCEKLLGLSEGMFERGHLQELLEIYTRQYAPLYPQFFERYPGTGDLNNAVGGGYASANCIHDFIERRGNNIQTIVDWIEKVYE